MTQQDELTFNKRVLDEEYNLGSFEVTAQMIRDFNDGTGERERTTGMRPRP